MSYLPGGRRIGFTISDPTETERLHVEVPSDVPIPSLIMALVKQTGLPETDQIGRPITYRLVHHPDNEKDIDPNKILADAGVNNGDALRLVADMQAGSHPSELKVSGDLNIVQSRQPKHSDLERIYSLLEELKSQMEEGESDSIVDTIQQELESNVEPYSIPMLISEQEREPIPLVRADRLHIIEEYRDEQNKWFSVTWAFIGASIGVVVNWVTADELVITNASVIIIIAFAIIGILGWFSAKQFEKRAERYKHIILYGKEDDNMALQNTPPNWWPFQ